MLDLLALQSSASNPTLVTMLYTMLLAFVLSSLVAYTYEKTFLGLSYSRNFVQAIILSSLVAAMVMQAIGDNVGRGLGMLGALAIVRFRTNFKDPKDIMFLFAALGAGIACGVYAWGVAVGGVLFFSAAAWVVARSGFGGDRAFDGLLRFVLKTESTERSQLEKLLRGHLITFTLVSMREIDGGGSVDCAYQIKLRPKTNAGELMAALSKVEGVTSIHFLMQEATTEL